MPEEKMTKTEEEWKKELTPDEYRILREKGTEVPFSGEYDTKFEDGMYVCAACGTQLFDSTHKYDSGCGWPAFDESIPGAVTYTEDNTLGMKRIEITLLSLRRALGACLSRRPEGNDWQALLREFAIS